MRLKDRLKFLVTNHVDTINTNPSMEELNAFFRSDIDEISSDKLNAASYYACMLIRCNAIAKLPVNLMQYSKSTGSRRMEDVALYSLLRNRPNQYTNAHDFLWATEFQRLHYGNAFWAMDTNRQGEITALYLLSSPNVNIIVDNTNILNKDNSVYYIYNDARAGQIVYLNDEIVHFKNFSMGGIVGTSIRKYLGNVVRNEQYADKVLSDKYSSGLQDPIIVKYAGDLSKPLENKIKNKFSSMGGAKNAGKVIPIPPEFDVEQLETKLVNSQFFELQGLTTRKIANAFGVKGFQLNDMEKSTYNNIEQQNKAFYSDTLQNVLTTYEQEMNYKMLTQTQKKEGLYFSFNVDSILRSDMSTRTNAYATSITSGWQTIAEVRAKEGLPYVSGTDKLIIGNGAAIPLEQLGQQYARGGE